MTMAIDELTINTNPTPAGMLDHMQAALDWIRLREPSWAVKAEMTTYNRRDTEVAAIRVTVEGRTVSNWMWMSQKWSRSGRRSSPTGQFYVTFQHVNFDRTLYHIRKDGSMKHGELGLGIWRRIKGEMLREETQKRKEENAAALQQVEAVLAEDPKAFGRWSHERPTVSVTSDPVKPVRLSIKFSEELPAEAAAKALRIWKQIVEIAEDARSSA